MKDIPEWQRYKLQELIRTLNNVLEKAHPTPPIVSKAKPKEQRK